MKNMKLQVAPVGIMNFFFMLGLAVVLTVDKELFKEGDAEMYDFLLRILPQIGHALIAFAVTVVLFTAFVLRNRYMEMLGLFMSGCFVLFVLAASLLTFPNISSVAYSVWTLASFMTIADIFNQIQDEKEEK